MGAEGDQLVRAAAGGGRRAAVSGQWSVVSGQWSEKG